MRRHHFVWTYVVAALVMLVYGVFSVFYSLSKQKDIPILGVVFIVIGAAMFILLLILYLIGKNRKPKHLYTKTPISAEELKEEPVSETKDEPEEEPKPEAKIEAPEVAAGSIPIEPKDPDEEDEEYEEDEAFYEPAPAPRPFRGGNAYVKRLGYGPVLRVEGAEILDMRSNTYYRIEGNYVKRMGSGPVFEISGNRIRAAYGSYLYEISGTSISKVYGGFYASVSGNFINLFDLSVQYEMSGSLNNTQILVVAALLFGQY